MSLVSSPQPAAPIAPSAPTPRWRQALLLVVGAALFLGFVALGTWQVQRRTAKLALIERVDQRVHAAPVALPPPATWPQLQAAAVEYLPVRLQGQWLPGKTVLTQAVSELGAGFWLVSALQLDDGTQVLVNRGFVPQAQRAQWLAEAAAEATQAAGTAPASASSSSLSSAAAATRAVAPVTVQGLLRLTEPAGGFLRSNDPAQQRWYSRDVAAIASHWQLPHAAPFFIDAGLPAQGAALTANANASATGPWPHPGLTVIRFHNSHVVYALTWYGLALMVVVAGWYVARYERRRTRHPSRENLAHDAVSTR